MITPTKGIAPDRCLPAVGAQILLQLDELRSVSQAWARLRKWRTDHGHHASVSFAWFVLAGPRRPVQPGRSDPAPGS
ncbi:ABC-three component system middle component 6 [Streptomyces tendae]|uniref:ABC-three component system middle component 6 n=1 Tax=Streptomyces tendae TaxID=1932 RepID=UPI00384E4113